MHELLQSPMSQKGSAGCLGQQAGSGVEAGQFICNIKRFMSDVVSRLLQGNKLAQAKRLGKPCVASKHAYQSGSAGRFGAVSWPRAAQARSWASHMKPHQTRVVWCLPAARGNALAPAQGRGARVSFQVADALHQPFEGGQFDLVWSMESGEHMPDKAQFVGELARVCKPGGRIIVVTWCHRWVAWCLCLQQSGS